MSDQGYRKAVDGFVEKMPALPVTISKVVEICNAPGTSPTDLNQVISVDPVLMARVMKLINSAYYGLSNRITSLVRAIIMLGINTVKNLALSTAVVGSLGKAENFRALNAQGYWRHSLGVGVAAKAIARHRGVDQKFLEEFFIAGLIHDIGKIPINYAASETYVEAMGLADRESIPLFQAEQRVFGFDHAEVGARIGEQWNIGEDIVDAIRFHHKPEEYEGSATELVYAIALANRFMVLAETGFSGDRHPQQLPEIVRRELNIDESFLDSIEDSVDEEIRKAEIFLKV
ncbi:MAG: HDOD domain-containing protein [Spirochaetaceae bacterium]